jgi:hypothetical protein
VVKENPDVDENWLVIHQQDIQAVVNALWAGGAEAMSIQDQRVISTTGIKCVGNSVVLHGVPYLPPYKITAIGDRRKLQKALDDSQYIENLQDYVVKFQLGYEVKNESSISDAGVRRHAGPPERDRPRLRTHSFGQPLHLWTLAATMVRMPRILVVDNYDSFVYNLVQYLQQLRADTTVLRNDEVTPDQVSEYDGVLLSPARVRRKRPEHAWTS